MKCRANLLHNIHDLSRVSAHYPLPLPLYSTTIATHALTLNDDCATSHQCYTSGSGVLLLLRGGTTTTSSSSIFVGQLAFAWCVRDDRLPSFQRFQVVGNHERNLQRLRVVQPGVAVRGVPLRQVIGLELFRSAGALRHAFAGELQVSAAKP